MIRHFSLDKSNTIIKGNSCNMGQNPILKLMYGGNLSRGLIWFDIEKINEWILDEGFSDLNKLSFKLHMTNCFSLDTITFDSYIENERASSFSIDIFKLNENFDNGKGYDYISDFLNINDKGISKEASNWRYSQGSKKWEQPGAYINNETTQIIASQNFNTGKEDLFVDISSYVMNVLNGEENYGIGLKFSENKESVVSDKTSHVAFFTDKTNTLFHPYIEVRYNEEICDNRGFFVNGAKNKLYFYPSLNGERIKLDEMPICKIDEKEYQVKCSGKGIYFAEIKDKFEDFSINYDIWSNLKYNGEDIDDVELEFLANPKNSAFDISNKTRKETVIPTVYGIDYNQTLGQDDVIDVFVDFRIQYEINKIVQNFKSEYRIYVKDANREYTIFDYSPIENSFLKNYFTIHTKDFVPGTYFVDIKTKGNGQTKTNKNVLKFQIQNDIK